MRILIAVPTFENISPETFKSIYNLKKSPDDILDFDFVKGYDCSRARNKIAEKAVDGSYDYVLMVDSDIILPSNALECLLEYEDDIILAPYPSKSDPSKLEIYRYGAIGGYPKDARFDKEFYYNQVKTENKYRYEINGGGFGCALVRTSTFTLQRKPWFCYMDYGDGSLLSEDLYFCTNSRYNGYTIYTDLRVQCSHISKKIYS